MHSANDTGAVDTLANFETAVRASRAELVREQQRYEGLVANVRAAEDRVKASQRSIADIADRCELLENECSRIAHANDQSREQIKYHREQMDIITAPRSAIESTTADAQKAVNTTRKDLCRGAMRATADVLASIKAHNPEDLKRRLAAKREEVAAASARVAKYKGDLARLTAAAAAKAADETDNANSSAEAGTSAASDGSGGAAPASDVENRFTLAKCIAALEAQLAAKKEANQSRMTDLTAARDALRPRIRSYGQSMPMAEQLAQTAENSYNELVDQAQGVMCLQCGGELGFEPLAMF